MNASRIIVRMPAGDSSSPRFPPASRSFAPAPLHWGEDAKGTEGTPVVAVGRTRTKVSESSPGSSSNATQPDVAKSWLPWIFAAKTTLSALLALLIAFTFNLDQPKWALLTVFVVAQPQSGLVLAKSFYRVIGTLVGAAAALSFVSLFAQERVLFLGALALWIGLCTFASQYAKNFTAYGFVLSGYTAAIVGISGALHPENAFYVAVARATEVGLAIVVTAIISQLLLPASLAPALRQALTAAQIGLAEYAAAILNGRDARSMRSTLLDEARAIRSQYASAIFEDRDIRERSSAVRRLDAAFMNVINLGELLGWQLERLRGQRGWGETKTGEAIVEAAAALADWRAAAIDASDLGRRLVQARSLLPRGRDLSRDAKEADAVVIHSLAAIARLRDFLVALAKYAHALEAFNSGKEQASRGIGSTISTDVVGATWAGLRAALALGLVAAFWILADWPSGSTATIFAAVVAALFATIENSGKAAIAGAFVAAFASIPGFVLFEVLLPQVQGFEMFALFVAPVLFLCAFLMADNKAPLAYLAGFCCVAYFASVGPFENRTTYDAIGFINGSIAFVFGTAVAALLFAIVASETPESARRKITRTVRRALATIIDPRRRERFSAFHAAITEALGQFKVQGAEDNAAREAAISLLGAGRALIRLRDDRWSGLRALKTDIAALPSHRNLGRIDGIRNQVQTRIAEVLADLRDGALSAAAARAAEREIITLSAIGDAIERGGMLLVGASEF